MDGHGLILVDMVINHILLVTLRAATDDEVWVVMAAVESVVGHSNRLLVVLEFVQAGILFVFDDTV